MFTLIKKIKLECIAFCIPIVSISLAYAQEIEIKEETKSLCNNIMGNIYYEILDYKDSYAELADFDENVLYENVSGIYAIVCENKTTQGSTPRSTYTLGLSIIRLNDNLFREKKWGFSFDFPLLGVKMVGYQPRYRLKSQFDIMPIIKKYQQQLADYQQELLPLRLYIEPVKKFYRVQEEILFDVRLKNVSKEHMYIKTLGSTTLFFSLNNSRWGTKPSDYNEGGESVILRAGEELRIRFKGDSYLQPKEVIIYGIYNVGLQGVKPYAYSTIQIIE